VQPRFGLQTESKPHNLPLRSKLRTRPLFTMSDKAQIILNGILGSLPVLIVGLVACILILARRHELSRAALWALLGFGIVVLLALFMPVLQGFLQSWVMENPQSASRDRYWMFGAIGIVHSVLRALSYIFLLVAIFAGRSAPASLPLQKHPYA
jgi:hypothetical protein